MKAALLEDVAKMVVRNIPEPELGPRDVLVRVGAVGVCGTDLHLFQGHGNYNFDSQGRPIPLTVEPQILGHEFSGEILEAGREVKDLKAGDRVLCDQGLNCLSQGRSPLCPYCASGDSHQCQYYREHGITGLPGALVEAVRELTSGERIHYLIEACGNPAVYQQVPSLIRKQATILIYGAGHKGLDISVLDPIFFMEPTLVAGIGASGGFDSDGRSLTYRRALDWVYSKKVHVLPFITHRYSALEDIHNAFERDFQREDYIKGVLTFD